MEIENSAMLFKEEAYAIMGACFDVHNELGCGFTEPAYQEALEIEFGIRGIPFKSQVELPIFYKDTKLKHGFRADFLCHESVIVELKSVSTLLPEHRSQVLNYLNAGRYELGMLVNFGAHPRLQHERIALTRKNAVESGGFSLREE